MKAKSNTIIMAGNTKSQSNIHFLSFLRSTVKTASMVVLGVGLAVLLGWFFDVPFLKSILPNAASMKFNTALCFLLAGVSLWFLQNEESQPKEKQIGRILAGLIVLISILTLSEYLFKWNLGIDQLLVKDLATLPSAYPGRMSQITAICFGFIGFALLWIDSKISQYFSLSVSVLSLLAVFGYVFDFHSLYRLGGYGSVALHTAFIFLIISFAVPAARPSLGIVNILSLNLPGSRMVRFLLPMAIILTAFLGWLVERGERLGLFDSSNESVVLVVLLILVYSPLIYFNGKKINQGEEKLHESEVKFSVAFHSSPLALVIAALDGKFIETNRAFCELIGYSHDEIIGNTAVGLGLLSAQDRERLVAVLKSTGGSVSNFEVQFHVRDGSLRDILYSLETISFRGVLHRLSTGVDITKRKQAEKQIVQLNRMYATLSQVNQTIVRVKDKDDLYQSICNVAVQFGGFSLAWIGLLDAQSGDLTPVAEHGLDENKLPFKGINTREKPYKEGLIGLSLRSGQVEFSNDIQVDPRMAHWREAAIKDQYHSAAAIPIQRNGQIVGLLNLYSPDIGFFAVKEEQNLLEEIGGDISFALDTLEIEAERKQAEEKIRRQLNYLTALQDIDRTIASAFDMRLSLNTLILKGVSLLTVDAAAVLLINSTTNTLEFAAGDGFRTNAVETASVKLGESYAGRAVMKKGIVKIPNLKNEPGNLFLTGFLEGEDFVGYYGAPLIVKGEVIGVLEIFQRSPIKRDQEWLDFLNALAGQAAIAISSAQLFDNLLLSNNELIRAYDATIEGWSRAMDLRDKETEGHTLRVTEMSLRLASLMHISDAEQVQIRRGALLHDIGKLGVPDAILLKPGKLTDEEWVIMRQHPTYAYEMLSSVEYLKPALDIPYCHHEKWDGTGYPRGLKDTQIPLVARIFAVVDVWDALRSDRPYRLGWPEEKVLDYLRAEAGKHFDPEVVEAFLNLTADK